MSIEDKNIFGDNSEKPEKDLNKEQLRQDDDMQRQAEMLDSTLNLKEIHDINKSEEDSHTEEINKEANYAPKTPLETLERNVFLSEENRQKVQDLKNNTSNQTELSIGYQSLDDSMLIKQLGITAPQDIGISNIIKKSNKEIVDKLRKGFAEVNEVIQKIKESEKDLENLKQEQKQPRENIIAELKKINESMELGYEDIDSDSLNQLKEDLKKKIEKENTLLKKLFTKNKQKIKNDLISKNEALTELNKLYEKNHSMYYRLNKAIQKKSSLEEELNDMMIFSSEDKEKELKAQNQKVDIIEQRLLD